MCIRDSLYADRITGSIQFAMDETQRRRDIQIAHNIEHGITPQTVRKAVNDILDTLGYQAQESRQVRRDKHAEMELEDLRDLLGQMEQAMLDAAKNLEFETAAALRDEMLSVKKQLNRKLDGLPIADQIAIAEQLDKIKVGVGTGRGPLTVEPKSPPKPGEPGSRRGNSRPPRRNRR